MNTANPKVLLINGPNLNLLGTREPGIYGSTTLPEIEAGVIAAAAQLDLACTAMQSNREYEIVEAIHQAQRDDVAFVIINPAAFTHTSVAIRDAFAGTAIPFIEVHLSNVHARESFRHHSYLSDIARGTIVGLGVNGYHLALKAVSDMISES